MQVVVGIITNKTGEILIAKRSQYKPYGGLWEFPGGKVEPDETFFAALQRELFEELGIQIKSADAWFNLSHVYDEVLIHLHIWRVLDFLNEPQSREGQALQWVRPENLSTFEFPEANEAIIRKLHT